MGINPSYVSGSGGSYVTEWVEITRKQAAIIDSQANTIDRMLTACEKALNFLDEHEASLKRAHERITQVQRAQNILGWALFISSIFLALGIWL